MWSVAPGSMSSAKSYQNHKMVRVWLTMIDSGAVEEIALLQAEDKGKVEAYECSLPRIQTLNLEKALLSAVYANFLLPYGYFFFLLGGKQSPLVVHHLLSSLSVCSSSSRSSHLFNPV